jgi:hypothetical protein
MSKIPSLIRVAARRERAALSKRPRTRRFAHFRRRQQQLPGSASCGAMPVRRLAPASAFVATCTFMGASSRIGTRLLIGLAGAMLVACASKDDPVNLAMYEADSGEYPPAECPTNLKPFTVGPSGLTESDSAMQVSVRIDDANKPPIKNYNDWTISILDANGQPNPTATLNWACAWMAVHGHGSNPKSIVNMGNGQYKLGMQNLSMTGPWEVRLWVDPTGQLPEYAPQAGARIMAGDECAPSNGAAPMNNIDFNFCVPEDSP